MTRDQAIALGKVLGSIRELGEATADFERLMDGDGEDAADDSASVYGQLFEREVDWLLKLSNTTSRRQISVTRDGLERRRDALARLRKRQRGETA